MAQRVEAIAGHAINVAAQETAEARTAKEAVQKVEAYADQAVKAATRDPELWAKQSMKEWEASRERQYKANSISNDFFAAYAFGARRAADKRMRLCPRFMRLVRPHGPLARPARGPIQHQPRSRRT